MARLPEVIYAVDDDVSFLKALLRLVRTAGIGAEGCGSAQELIERLPLPKHVCLIIDIVLGRESGLDIPLELCDRGETPPVIFISATDDDALLARAQQFSGQPCLRKPFESEAVFQALRLAMQLHKQRGLNALRKET